MKFLAKLLIIYLVNFLSIFAGNTCEYNINVGGFNIESGQSDIKIITKQISENSNIKIWGIVESNNKSLNEILKVLRKTGDYKVIAGTTGGANGKMQIFYDSSLFEPIYQTELHYINYKNRVRSPLVVKFLDLKSHADFYLMVNHLYRSNDTYRHKQAELLNLWGKNIGIKDNIPVIALGDYNFDMYYKDIDKRDKGFDNLVQDGVFHWIKPNILYPTQCSRYKSILDFVFISANNPANFQINSEILYKNDQYCSYRGYYSDHRPVVANINYRYKCQ